ncbi:penicillin amidase [Oxalobacteraceae bacterium GrIS 1.11]
MQKNALKRWFLRILSGLAGLLLLLALAVYLFLRGSLARLDGIQAGAGLGAKVSIARDARGVPLISGGDRLDVAYATGFVHAQERFFQMDLLRRSGAGELAELFGPRALNLDKSHRLHRFRARAELAVQAMTPEDRLFLARYVSGVNDGMNALATRPFEYALIGVKPRAWTAADSLLVLWAMYIDLQGNLEPRELARGWLREHSSAEQLAFLLPESTQWDAPLDADGVPASVPAVPAMAPLWWGQMPTDGAPKVAAAEWLDAVGSNNWAVAGRRGADGAAILSNDMHLGIQLPNTWYRLALQFPDGLGGTRRVVGVTLPGAPPVVVVGSNGHVAWGYTNSYGDYLDLIELGVDAARPGQARTPGGWESLVAHTELILVKGAPAETLQVRESSLGPVRVVAGRSYAIHWVAHALQAVNMNPKKLESAATLDEALATAATLGIPAENFVGADDKGNIGWTIAGPLPRRSQPGWAATFPLALGQPQASWQGWLAPADYPRVINPARGHLSTANSRQLMEPGAALLGDGGFDLGARNRQVDEDLRALGAKTDLQAVYGVMLDDRALFLAPWRARAMAALDGAAIANRPQRAQFLQLLQTGWTGHASTDSVAYRLTRGFMYGVHDVMFDGANVEMGKLDAKASMASATPRWPVLLARLLDERPAAWLPPQYASWQALQLAAIDRVIADLGQDGKALAAATWGARNTAAIAHPIGTSLPWLGDWLAAPADQLAGDNHMPRVAAPKFGQSERLTVSPGKEEQGVFNMPGGQSGHPLSPFFLNGHQDWVQGKTEALLPGPAQHTLTLTPVKAAASGSTP